MKHLIIAFLFLFSLNIFAGLTTEEQKIVDKATSYSAKTADVMTGNIFLKSIYQYVLTIIDRAKTDKKNIASLESNEKIYEERIPTDIEKLKGCQEDYIRQTFMLMRKHRKENTRISEEFISELKKASKKDREEIFYNLNQEIPTININGRETSLTSYILEIIRKNSIRTKIDITELRQKAAPVFIDIYKKNLKEAFEDLWTDDSDLIQIMEQRNSRI